MGDSQDLARRLGESVSALLNCSHHILVEPNPSAEVLEALAAAVDHLLAVQAELQVPPQVDKRALAATMSRIRDSLAQSETARLPDLCRELFAALAVPIPPTPTTAA